MRFLVLAALILSGCTRKPTPNEGTTVTTRASTAPTVSASIPAAAAAEDGEPSWAPPKPKLKPEASVCKKGVVTECEFWRAALRQTLRLDPPCAEDDPNFRYPWGSDGVKLRRLKIQYPGAKSCDVDLGDSITIRCYFPLRTASESATTRARILAESFNECVAEEFATRMVVNGNDDVWFSVHLSPVPDEFAGLTVAWRNQSEGGKAGTDQLKIYYLDAPWLKPGPKQAPAPLPKAAPSAATAQPKTP